MVMFASELAARGIDIVTFNFSYIERGRGAPDPGDKLEACYRSVIAAARAHKKLKGNKLRSAGNQGRPNSFTGGSQGLDNLAGLGFGLSASPAGKNRNSFAPSTCRNIVAPMLFVQGSRDSFGTPEELRPIIKKLEPPCKLYEVLGGDHSLKVPKSAGIPQEQVYTAVQDEIANWLRAIHQ